MRTSGFSNGAGILAAFSLLILAGPTTPIAQEDKEPAAAAAIEEAVAASLSEEIRALREELRVAKAQIQILKSTIDAVAAQSAAQSALAMAKPDELAMAQPDQPDLGRTRGWQRGRATPASTSPAAAAPTGQATEPGVISFPNSADRPAGSAAATSTEGPGAGATPDANRQFAALSTAGSASDELMIGEVHFNPGSADLTPGARSRTAQAAESFKAMGEGRVRVVGYTDTTGNAGYNQHLATRRADSIAALLESLGVARERIEVIGRGEEDTPVPTDDQVAEPLNRCAGIFVVAQAAN